MPGLFSFYELTYVLGVWKGCVVREWEGKLAAGGSEIGSKAANSYLRLHSMFRMASQLVSAIERCVETRSRVPFVP